MCENIDVFPGSDDAMNGHSCRFVVTVRYEYTPIVDINKEF